MIHVRSPRTFSLLEFVAAMPVWMAGAIAALIVVACLLAFNGTGRERMLGGVGLILLGVGIIWILLDGSARRDLAVERRALDATSERADGPRRHAGLGAGMP